MGFFMEHNIHLAVHVILTPRFDFERSVNTTRIREIENYPHH